MKDHQEALDQPAGEQAQNPLAALARLCADGETLARKGYCDGSRFTVSASAWDIFQMSLSEAAGSHALFRMEERITFIKELAGVMRKRGRTQIGLRELCAAAHIKIGDLEV